MNSFVPICTSFIWTCVECSVIEPRINSEGSFILNMVASVYYRKYFYCRSAHLRAGNNTGRCRPLSGETLDDKE